MNILGLLVKTNDTTIAYTTTAMPWTSLEARKTNRVGTIVVLNIPMEYEWAPKFLSLDKLFVDYPTMYKDISSWTNFLVRIEAIENLKDYFVRTLVPTKCVDKINGVTTVIDTPFYSTMHGVVKYLNLVDDTRLSVTTNDNDLVITKTADAEFSSNNTIPSVRGVVCYSSATDNTYIAHNGNYIQNVDNKLLRDISFLDFSELGTLTRYKLSDCDPIFITGDSLKLHSRVISSTNVFRYMKSATTFNAYSKSGINIACILPVGAKAGIPIMCLAGRLFFPNFDKLELFKRTDGRYGVIFSINRVMLESIISVNLARQTPAIMGLNHHKVDVSSFLNNLFIDKSTIELDPTKDDCTIPHILILDTPHSLYLETSQQLYNFDNGTIVFPKRSQGMLINSLSRDIIHNTQLRYDSKTLVTVGSSYKRYLIQNEAPTALTTTPIGVGWTNYNEKDIHNPFYKKPIATLDNLVLLDIGWGDKQEMYTPEPFVPTVDTFEKITLQTCGRLKRIWKIKSPITATLTPVALKLSNNGIDQNIQIDFEDATGVYTLTTGVDSTREWTRVATPIIKIKFNDILQAWVLVDGGDNILYQSDLSATLISSITPEYADPWDVHLMWYKPVNNM